MFIKDIGYWAVFCPDHPHARRGGYVLEHRLVWEKANGRILDPSEHVHHVDGNPLNNDPTNLVALTRRQHVAVHADSKQTSRRKSLGQKRRMQDPEERKRHSERIRAWWADRRAAREHQVATPRTTT